MLKLILESGTQFFVAYNDCYFNDLVIAVGLSVNSFSGFFNTFTTISIQGLNMLNLSAANNLLVMMYNASITNSPIAFGISIGMLISKTFNVQVPDVQPGSTHS